MRHKLLIKITKFYLKMNIQMYVLKIEIRAFVFFRGCYVCFFICYVFLYFCIFGKLKNNFGIKTAFIMLEDSCMWQQYVIFMLGLNLVRVLRVRKPVLCLQWTCNFKRCCD
eukprot:TRINITY_DN12266_c1_g1_i1.p4 TRINITY_DN12266_c1_g1~~TRINITY_DN12266_c1_g1_i1.p4  ORF type:complete len:111 (+),score=4.43 TRINITY_DN12266_c1_g1_i1:152-484(+)